MRSRNDIKTEVKRIKKAIKKETDKHEIEVYEGMVIALEWCLVGD